MTVFPSQLPTTRSGNACTLGLCSLDFLQHCVVELRAPARVPGSPKAPVFTVAVHAPDEFEPSPRCQASWQRVEWVASVPHVRVGVGRCRLTVSRRMLKAPMVSALETRLS